MKKYEELELELIRFDPADIVVTSGFEQVTTTPSDFHIGFGEDDEPVDDTGDDSGDDSGGGDSGGGE